jgi:integrase
MASIDRRPNGKWRARWREYPGGPQKARHFARKLDAERFLVDVQHKMLTGAYVDPAAGRITLDAYADQWLARQQWRASSVVTATNALAHARRTLGSRPLGSIRKGDVQALVAGLALAPGTVENVHAKLSTLFEAAVEDGLLARNPAKGAKLPSTAAGEVVPPTADQVAAVYEAAEPWLRPAVVLGAGLGLRSGEATGLTLDRVLWLERVVRVDRQWLSRHGLAEFGPPKSKASHRMVPASDFVLDQLGAYVGRRHDGFVVHREGEPVNYNDFGYWWRKAATGAGLGRMVKDETTGRRSYEGMRYHDLRHAFASMLISAGCSVKAVQMALGHASAATTLNIYTHLWPGDDEVIRRAVDRGLVLQAEDWLRTGSAEG